MYAIKDAVVLLPFVPVTQIVAGYYDEVSKAGGKRWDTSSLITRL